MINIVWPGICRYGYTFLAYPPVNAGRDNGSSVSNLLIFSVSDLDSLANPPNRAPNIGTNIIA